MIRYFLATALPLSIWLPAVMMYRNDHDWFHLLAAAVALFLGVRNFMALVNAARRCPPPQDLKPIVKPT